MDEPNHLACREYDQLLSPTNDAPGQRKLHKLNKEYGFDYYFIDSNCNLNKVSKLTCNNVKMIQYVTIKKLNQNQTERHFTLTHITHVFMSLPQGNNIFFTENTII